MRSATSLIQIIGRAARNQNGAVVMYADTISPAMKEAIAETEHRRAIQSTYNEAHGITPETVHKAISDILVRQEKDAEENAAVETKALINSFNPMIPKERKKLIKALEQQMLDHAERLEYEEAAALRNEIEDIKKKYGS